MLSAKDNDLLCRVGPDTAMGMALRQFWTPFLQSSDLPKPGGDPRRVELLGQTFVAFRGSDGVVALLDERCCHRGASLTLGRVEGCSIRCLFHGWKFAADGTLLETPNVADPRFRERVKARAYPVREAGGLVWAYLGLADQEPPFPSWTWLQLPDRNRVSSLHIVDCNFVQVTEALVDSAHVGILHADGLSRSNDVDLPYAERIGRMSADLAPRLEVEETRTGFRYAALRQSPDRPNSSHTRVQEFVAPYSVFNGHGDIVTITVPANDTRTLFFHVFWDKDNAIGEEPMRSQQLSFTGLNTEALERYGIALDSPEESRPSYHNGFYQDRAAMDAGRTFTGLPGIIEEDVAIAVSSGAIRDRTVENLCPSDLAVAALYKSLLKLARAEPPITPTTEGDVAARGWERTLGPDDDWRTYDPDRAGTRVDSEMA